jgi:hypothetical protein
VSPLLKTRIFDSDTAEHDAPACSQHYSKKTLGTPPMTFRKTLISLVTTYTLLHLSPVLAASAPVFTPEQEAQIGKIAADYLVAHPEVLVQVSQKLQQQEQERQQMALTQKVMDNQDALLRDKDTPVIGRRMRAWRSLNSSIISVFIAVSLPRSWKKS